MKITRLIVIFFLELGLYLDSLQAWARQYPPLFTNSPYQNGFNGVGLGEACTQGSDCQSGYCDTIVAHACTDGSNGSYCVHASDCASHYCSEGVGQICTDGS